MNDLFDLIMLTTAFASGYLYHRIKVITEISNLQTKYENMNKKQQEDLQELGVKDIHKLKHEIVNDVHYFYIEENNKFVAQGKTLEDAATHYTNLQGKDVLGWFTHNELNKNYCFVNDTCMEFKHESK